MGDYTLQARIAALSEDPIAMNSNSNPIHKPALTQVGERKACIVIGGGTTLSRQAPVIYAAAPKAKVRARVSTLAKSRLEHKTSAAKPVPNVSTPPALAPSTEALSTSKDAANMYSCQSIGICDHKTASNTPSPF